MEGRHLNIFVRPSPRALPLPLGRAVSVHFLPCYGSPVHLASSQRSSLRSCVLASCYLLGASHGPLFFCHRLWRLRRLEAFPGENHFRDCLVELHNVALNLWRWNTVSRCRV